jgi:hypothetical protein
MTTTSVYVLGIRIHYTQETVTLICFLRARGILFFRQLHLQQNPNAESTPNRWNETAIRIVLPIEVE